VASGAQRVICKICWVSGRVQGVYFRGSAQARASELGIAGYARNLDDGRVEVLACADAARIEAFIAWLWVGPTAAHVTGVEVVDHEPAEWPTDFATG
jgi:acylphosphatase